MNVWKFPRGTICVERLVDGDRQWLAIPQDRYREWVGCFSVWEV